MRGEDALGALVDEAELAEQTDEARVLEFGHQLALKSVDGASKAISFTYWATREA